MPNKRGKKENKKVGKRAAQPTKKTNVKSNPNKKVKSHPKLRMVIKIFIIAFLLLCVIGAGIIAAIFFGLFGNEFEISKSDLVVGASNSIVLDKNGVEIANLSSDEKRKTISISEMSSYLPKAYVSIEDKRFYKHNGVDLKRTTGAILGVITKNSSYGGSTITQQLVKNITNDKARSGIAGITRKVKEWAKAVQVERMISKDQILELYLNIIYIGGSNLHGVELGSQYYFSKSAKDLTLAECAFLAGINSKPVYYDPFDEEKDQEKLSKERIDKTLIVLEEMKKQNMITAEEHEEAVKEAKELKFTKGYIESNAAYSHHTDATVKAVIEQVMEEKDISEELARNYVYGSGLKIFSTQDTEIQAAVEEEFAKTKYQIKGREKNKDGSFKNDTTQAGIVIIDNEKSQVVAIGGNLGASNAVGLNRGIQATRQTGSSMKPLADIAPALQEKVITAATVYDDSITDFGGNYKPGDYNAPRGLINIRSCIKSSQNIPMVKIMMELKPSTSIAYLKKMGITTLHKEDDNPALSIGGLSEGITPFEMAGAYSSIANDGTYTTPILFTKVVDQSGNVVLTSKQEKVKVISEQNAYITRQITAEPTKAGGTATYCLIPGIETCAKTGSTDDYKDRWLCGMTPYYSAACWWGFDTPEPLKYANGTVYSVDGINPAGQLWATIMKKIHKNLPNKNFNVPSGIVRDNVCTLTGCLAVEGCSSTYEEIFTADNKPEACKGHGSVKVCLDTGLLANEYCTNVEERNSGGTIPKEELGLWRTIGRASAGAEIPTETCTTHKKPEEKPKPKPDTNVINETNKTNTTNTTNTNTNTNTNVNTNTTTEDEEEQGEGQDTINT